MKIVLDTNVLFASVSRYSTSRWVLEEFLNEKYTLCVTTEILDEYAEIIERHFGASAAESLLQIMENAPNVLYIHHYLRWNMIYVDADDNKFIDCAIASNAQYVVSEDKHFKVLKTIPFPKITVLKTQEFKMVLDKLA